MNKLKGRTAEVSFALGQTVAGKNIKKTGRGHDYKVGKTYYEIKSSQKAPLSPLQKKNKKKLKGRFKEFRFGV